MGEPQVHMNSLADWADGKFDVSLFHAAHTASSALSGAGKIVEISDD
jgi:hypothetical protein